MRVVALAAACAVSVSAAGDPDAQTRLSMAKDLARDPDTTAFLCGEARCSAQDIESLLEYKCERAGSEVDVCILEPERKAMNMYIGVFARKPNSEYRLQFIFFGSGIGLAKSTYSGVRTLTGREIEEGGAILSYQYCWNGSYYTNSCPKDAIR